MFFHKVKKKKVSTFNDPQPPTPSVPDVILPSLFSSAQPSPPSKMMILMTLLPFCQKVNSQVQCHNAYTITPLHLLNVGTVLSSYHHHHHHQWSLEQQEWRSCFDEKTWFLLLMQRFDGKSWFLLFCHPLKPYMILYSTGTVFFHCSIISWGLG